MALIECKECGKRISDTTRVCIHCGAPTCVSKPDAVGDSENTQKQSQNGVAHDVENKQKEPEAQAEKTEPRSIFQKLDKNTQCELEEEFWKVDKRAKKYRIKNKFSRYFLILGFSYVWYYLIVVFILDNTIKLPDSLVILNWDIYHIFYSGHFEYAALVLPLIGVICMIVGTVKFIHETGQSKKEVLYKKRFQAWLLMEKNVDYIPQFMSESDRNLWRNTDINKKL